MNKQAGFTLIELAIVLVIIGLLLGGVLPTPAAPLESVNPALSMRDLAKTSASDLADQAKIYGKVFETCLAVPACKAIETWGFSDKYSWIPGFFPGMGAALPFDDAFAPKPPFRALIDQMKS